MAAAAPGGQAAGSSPEGPSVTGRRQAEARRAAGNPSLPGMDAAWRRLRLRNALTGLGIGAIVAGIYAYTFYSVSQERFLDELEVEAKVLRAQAAKTPSD